MISSLLLQRTDNTYRAGELELDSGTWDGNLSQMSSSLRGRL